MDKAIGNTADRYTYVALDRGLIMASTLTSKGQATIPVVIRRHLGLRPGDKIDFFIDPEGAVKIRPVRYPTIESLRGAAGSLKRPQSKEEMLRIAREDALQEKIGKGR
jgi:AbrB family looped-hinge helix DNA binding protein